MRNRLVWGKSHAGLLLGHHSAHIATTHDMNMQMWHILHAIRPGVGYRAKSVAVLSGLDAGHAADLADGTGEIKNFGV